MARQSGTLQEQVARKLIRSRRLQRMSTRSIAEELGVHYAVVQQARIRTGLVPDVVVTSRGTTYGAGKTREKLAKPREARNVRAICPHCGQAFTITVNMKRRKPGG